MISTPAEPFRCLTEVDLFADLSQAEIDAMDLMTPARLFRAGELVFSQSQPVTALFILKAGRVRVFRVTEDGKALTMAILEPGAVFGDTSLVGQRMYDNDAEAIEDAAICQLTVAEVGQYFLSDPRIAVRISRLLGEQVAQLEERLTDLALQDHGRFRRPRPDPSGPGTHHHPGCLRTERCRPAHGVTDQRGRTTGTTRTDQRNPL